MNVGIFTDTDFGTVNGVTTSLRAVLRYAPESICPHIYTASEGGDDSPGYFAAKSIGVGLPFYREMRMYLPRLNLFLQKVRHDGIDLVHFTTPGPIGLAARFVAWRAGLRTVGSVHTHLAACTAQLSGSDNLGALMAQYLRWCYGRCDRVLVPSESSRDVLVGSGVDATKVTFWGRGVDTDLFSPTKRSQALRDHWGVSDRRPAIIYAGRISQEKGLALLPGVRSALYRRGIDHRFVLVGDGPMRAELQARLPDAVFTGALSSQEVAVALASSDLFLFPSETDSAGNVVLEAQASGIPVLVSDRGGPKEYIRPNQTGCVCFAGDAEGFACHGASLLHEVRRRRQMSDAARAHALTLGWDAALQPLYQVYTEVAARGRAAGAGSAAPAVSGGAVA